MKVRINNNAPTATQRRALRQQCVEEFDKLLAGFNRDVALQVLHILHFEYGFGQKRLEAFSEKMKAMQDGQAERYQLTDSDTPWLCERQLREAGIDVDKFLKEGK